MGDVRQPANGGRHLAHGGGGLRIRRLGRQQPRIDVPPLRQLAGHRRLAGRVELPRQPQGEVGDRALPALPERRDPHPHGGRPIGGHGRPDGVEDLDLREVRDEVPHERLGPVVAVVAGQAREPRPRMPERQHLRPQVQEPDVGVPAQRRRQRPRKGVEPARRRPRTNPATHSHQRDQRPRRRIGPEQLQRQLLGVGGRDVVQRDDQQQPDREVRQRGRVRERERIRGPGRRDLAQPGPDGRQPEVNPDDGHRTHRSGTAIRRRRRRAPAWPAAGARRIIWISAITSAKDP